MHLKKFFPIFIFLIPALFFSCASTKKNPEDLLCKFTLSVLTDGDPYDGPERHFMLRDADGGYSVEITEEGEEIVTGEFPLQLAVEYDEDGEKLSDRTDLYSALLEEGKYRLFENERDLNVIVFVSKEKASAVFAECSSIDAAAKILRETNAPSALGVIVKERTYQTLGYDNLLQRALASCKNPVSMDMTGCINTSVGYRAFYGCPCLCSILLPESSGAFGKDSFYGCTSLEHVNVPGRLSSIEGGAFTGCTSLKEIDVSEKNKKYSGKDGYIIDTAARTLVAWPGASGSISVPENVDVLHEYCFAGCTSLDSVDLSGTMEIQKNAFLECRSLEEINIPLNLMIIETGAFEGCVSLSRINIEPGNASYKSNGGILLASDNRRLLAWPSAQGNVKVPEGITRIDDNAFQNQKGLKSITMSSTVKEIGSQAFTSCPDLVSVSMPAVVSIEAYAFSKCASLSDVSIPESTRRCDGSAFSGCISLNKISVSSANAQYKAVDGAIYSADGKTLVEWPAAKGNVTVPGNVESIGTFAFNGCSELKSVTMTSVVNVGHHAFDSCKSLESVDFGNAVTVIGSHAFSNCLSIKDLYIPESVETVKNYAFWFWGKDQTIRCQASYKPAGWDFAWNADSEASLVWGVQEK